MRVIAGGRRVPADVMSVVLGVDESGETISAELSLLFRDESDANAVAGLREWEVAFEDGLARVSEGEKMLREAIGRGRALTMEEMVAHKLMGSPENGVIFIKSVSVTPPPPHVARLPGLAPRGFHIQDECRVDVVGWFPAWTPEEATNGKR